MKLRVRWGKKTVVVSLVSQTLGNLKEEVSRQFEIQAFALSLNRRDPLQGEDDTSLSEFEMVSGDLVFVLSDEAPPPDLVAAPASKPEPQKKAQNDDKKTTSLRQTTMDTNQPASSTFVSTSTTCSSASRMSAQGTSSTSASATAAAAAADEDFDADSMDTHEAIKDAEVNRYLNEPMLLQDCTDGRVTQSFRRVYEGSEAQNPHEAVCVALHVLMSESRFQAQPDVDASHQMPANWRVSGAYKLAYTHPNSADCTFQLVCVPMGALLIVHGTAQLTSDEGEGSRYQLQIRSTDYIKALDPDPAATYRSLNRLARVFKDTISYPLLQSAQPDGQTVPSLVNLVYEVKLVVLKYLDVKSLLRATQTCQHLKTVASDNILWRRLYLKDFGRRTNNDLVQNWKQFYREKYLLRKQMREDFYRRMTVIVPPYVDHPHPPFPFTPVYPPGFIGGDYDLDPGFPGIPGPFGHGGRGPILPRPRFDPIGPLPGQIFPPGRGRGIWESGSNRRRFGGGGGGFGPRFF